MLLKSEQLTVELDAQEIFTKANFEINAQEHIALIGRNGVGKTTFIKALLKKTPIKNGKIINQLQESDIGWLEQAPAFSEGMKTKEILEQEDRELFYLKEQMEKTLNQENKMDAYTEMLQKYMDLNGYQWEAKIEKYLTQLGIPKEVWNIPFQDLSGGQKTRSLLAKAMLKEPKLLILDEPTNHLDKETTEWLASWLQKFNGAILFISHDRLFIDQVAEITYELTKNGTRKYIGGYTKFKEQKKLEQKTQEAAYRKQEQERKQLQDAVNQYKQWFAKAHHAASERNPFAKKKANKNMTRFKAKEKALERLENNKVEKPKEQAKISVEFEDNDFSGKTMVLVDKVDFGYEKQNQLFKSLSFVINQGDHMAVIGPNGSGKTTLLNLITKKLLPSNGEITHHPQLKIGYFMQELQELNPNDTILDYILALPNMTQSEARTILACFLFKREDVFQKIGSLSMGEKCRVAFVKLYFSQANLLVLDEPTNYLDIETRERIEDALAIYPGAVVTVSHDEYFLQKIANKVISLQDNQAMYYPGDYQEWISIVNEPREDQEIKNKRSQLQLQLTNLLVMEEPDSVEEKQYHFQQIKAIKEQIARLSLENN